MSLLLQETALPLLGPALFLATVVNVADPDNRNRVQVLVYGADGVDGQNGPVWARVAVPFAGASRGAFFIPDVGDEVVVAFVGGDPRFPVTLGGGGQSVDRWTITGKAGSRIAIVEQPASSATITLSTPGGQSVTITDQGTSITLTNSSQNSVTIDSSGITINAAAGQVQITAASEVTVNAPSVTVNAATSTFSGIVQCQVMQATTVVASTYTPGAGNVW
jgi:uncharacterized protein involved in type VI secretion and phage assembly